MRPVRPGVAACKLNITFSLEICFSSSGLVFFCLFVLLMLAISS